MDQIFEQKWWSSLCSQVLGDQLSQGGIWIQRAVAHDQLQGTDVEGSCPRLLLGSCVLRAPGRSLGAEVVVLPVLTGVSALLGDQLSPSNIYVWSTMAQDQLQA